MKKKICIDCRMWNETGIGRYIRNIVYKLAKLDKDNNYVLLVLKKDFENISLPSNFSLIVFDVRWYTFKEQLLLPFILYKEKLDLFFAPNLNVPVLYFKKFIVTIHDLTVLKIKTGRVTTLPKPFYYLKRMAVVFVLYYAIYFSKKIFVVTNFVKQDLIDTFKINSEKVMVTYCAVESSFQIKSTAEISNAIKKYNIKKPYIFYIGNAHPHKNLERLIKSFELLYEKRKDLTLVLGGKKDFFFNRLEEESRNNKSFQNIKFIGFVDDKDLPALYSGAQLYVNPSLHEGFGIQTLESFACGTKVVSSNTTSLPEIGGNIAYYFNPYDTKAIADTILKALDDTNEDRIKVGLEKVKTFSWEKSAQIILQEIKTWA